MISIYLFYAILLFFVLFKLITYLVIDGETMELADDEESKEDDEEEDNRELRAQMRAALCGGGAYETVVVILQDLAAVELEEAFDCMDVVVKSEQYATVIVDQ